jgi:pSer/pThr/pTyr-binding forkhead associated (FHA) protein
MMRLKVSLQNQIIKEVTLSQGREYLAGRGENCDVILQGDKGISREHFKLLFEGGSWNIKVLSRFGEVYLAGKKIQESALSPNTVFQLAQYTFELINEPDFNLKDEENALNSLDDKTVVGVAPSVPYIKALDSRNQTKSIIRLEGGDCWIAGRESQAQIHIEDPRVSRRQFEIRRQGLDFFIMDPGSVNGTFVNGNALPPQKPMPLRSGDAIAILDNYFCFELHDPDFKRRLDLIKQLPAPILSNVNMNANSNQISDLKSSESEIQKYTNSIPTGAADWAQPPTPHYPNSEMGQELGSYLGSTQEDSSGPQGFHSPNLDPNFSSKRTSKKFDYKKHRPALILGTVALVFLIYIFGSQDDSDGPAKKNPKIALDPFGKLTPDQQALVKQSYQLAKNYYMQGHYESSRGEVMKMKEFIPDYMDSESLLKLIDQAIYNQQETIRIEKLEKDKIERDQKINERTTLCEKRINSKMTTEMMDECLAEVVQFDPNHSRILALKARVEQIVTDEAIKLTQRSEYLSRVAQLKGIFDKAEKIQNRDGPIDGIQAYQKVIKSHLPDPHGLKAKAQKIIDATRNDMTQKSAQFLKEADESFEKKRLKDAIFALRKAMKANPENIQLQSRIDQYMAELKKQMMPIFQEGIIEENFGNVFGADNKSGAMEKWRKIIELDVPDGEYYRKAAIKIKKYGAL